MGRCPTRKVKKRRLSHKTARRDKFEVKGDDLVYTELRKLEAEVKPLQLDEDLSGMGQFYCLHCDRYFSNASLRDDHFRTKKHKQRVKTGKVKKRRLSHITARGDKFEVKGDDLVYTELRKPEAEVKPLQLDEDLPGMGQFYCLHCDRYFSNASVRDDHFNTKKHKKRVKIMNGPAPHSQLDADLAGGMGMPDNGPQLMAV